MLKYLTKSIQCSNTLLKTLSILIVMFIAVSVPLSGQQATRQITGVVIDSDGAPLPGVSILLKGTTNGTASDINGQYTLRIPDDNKAVLQFTYIGFLTQEITVGNLRTINVTMSETTQLMEEVVVVGYGVQKRESIVGAIVQASSKELKRTGSGSDFATALSSQLPGVISLTSSGEPGGVLAGESATEIFIRGRTTWNTASPLILVDGIERDMSSIEINEVESISVLKDASATAVFGVKGANGVILINTKRGYEGQTKLNFNYQGSALMVSKLPQTLDSYEAMMIKNEMIEREVHQNAPSWPYYVPQEIVERYRRPQSDYNALYYPNIDWREAMFKNTGYLHRFNLNAQGGNKTLRYFGSLAYLHEGDMIKRYENYRSYDPRYDYERFNFRSNVDVNITRTTKFRVNLGGFLSIKHSNTVGWDGQGPADSRMWAAAYGMAPNLFPVQYPDGAWGGDIMGDIQNPVAVFSSLGTRQGRIVQLNSDFQIDQDLSKLIKGLSLVLKLSFDNRIRSDGSIVDRANGVKPDAMGTNIITRYIKRDNTTGEVEEIMYPLSSGEYDFVVQPWTRRPEIVDSFDLWQGSIPLTRRLNYEGRLSYARQFGKHAVGATGVFMREEYATGSMFPRYREDWIFRGTYDFDSRYFVEVSGAYNGSEKFGPGYRFALFPSMGVSWMASNEKFLANVDWLTSLKFRYGVGKTGDDTGGSRWAFQDQWARGGFTQTNNTVLSSYSQSNHSPYTWYRNTVLGNPDLRWDETVTNNFGLDASVLNRLFSVSFDYFFSERTGIIIAGSSRNIPAYFGFTPPAANLGITRSKGFEIDLNFNKTFANRLNIWGRFAIAHNENKIIFRDDPELRPAYMKNEGYSIGQQRSLLNTGYYMQNWDDVYASVVLEANDAVKMPGYYGLVDFSADGLINTNSGEDNVPIGYAESPQNTYNTSLGANYKGLGLVLQFYGINNASRFVERSNWTYFSDVLFDYMSDYWSKDNPNATTYIPRFRSTGQPVGHYFLYDASFVRLKTVELSYDVDAALAKKLGLSNLRFVLRGNDLILWTKMPDDRQTTYSGGGASQGAYPMTKSINLGVELSF